MFYTITRLSPHSTNLWPNCSYHCALIHVFEGSKLTAVVVGGQLRVVKKLFMTIKADRKQNAKQFNPQLLLFLARRHRKQPCKTQCKDGARPRAKAAYHCMNELEDKTRMKRIVQMKKLSCPTMKTTVTVTTTTLCIVL